MTDSGLNYIKRLFHDRTFLYDPSLWSLGLSNLIVLFWALVDNWHPLKLVLIYLGQSLIIGFFWFIKMLAAKDYIKLNFECMSCPLYSNIEAIAVEYFDFIKKDDEDNPSFVKRFSSFLSYQIPKNADFSKFK